MRLLARLIVAFALLIVPAGAWAAAGGVVDVTGLVPPLGFTMKSTATGRAATAADFRGKIVMLYFGYTNCPDVCPDTLYKVHTLLRKMGPAAKDIVFLFVTVDPSRDTLKVMKKYLALFDPHLVGLRGDANQLYRLTRRYRVVASVHPSPDPEKYLVVHSSLIYVFGRRGNARYILPDLGLVKHPDYRALAGDIEALQQKQKRGLLTWLARLG